MCGELADAALRRALDAIARSDQELDEVGKRLELDDGAALGGDQARVPALLRRPWPKRQRVHVFGSKGVHGEMAPMLGSER